MWMWFKKLLIKLAIVALQHIEESKLNANAIEQLRKVLDKLNEKK